jgi:hypothetical protein
MRAKPGLGLANLALVSVYFAPVWGHDALWALRSPYSAFADRARAALAVSIRDLFDFGLDGLIRTSNALAGIKLVIAAGFLAYLIEFARALATRRMPDRATVDALLPTALAASMVWLVSAFTLADARILRVEATQFLMLVAAAIVVMIERRGERRIERSAAPAALGDAGKPQLMPQPSIRFSAAAPALLPQAPRSDLPAGRPA